MNPARGHIHCKPLKLLLVFLLATCALPVRSQTCTASYVVVNNGNGSYSFFSTSTPSTGNLTWNFSSGAPSIAFGPTATVTYSANGTVSVSLTNSAVPCFTSVTNTLAVTGVTCPAVANFSFTFGGPGQVFFNNSSTGTYSGTIYQWNFGNGNFSNAFSPSHTYTANGVYTVVLSVNNPSQAACYDSIPKTVTITTIPTCTAAYSYSIHPGGIVTFTSLSSPATSSTSYMWTSSAGHTFTSSGTPTASMSFTAPGVYTVTLTAITPPFCNQSVSQTFTITSVTIPCPLIASFSYAEDSMGVVRFVSTTAGSNAATSYSWNLGNSASASGSTVQTTYPANGPYTVTLYAVQNGTCFSTVSLTIFVTTHSCAPALITHTASGAGVVTFSSAYNSALPSAVYHWDFGDGYSTTGGVVTHTYQNGGTHYVTHKLLSQNGWCRDSIVQAINITGVSCVANAAFTLSQTAVSKHWVIVPLYPWNISAASWSWGDGSSSPGLMASHVYSASGLYTICLTVTASCGSTATACAGYSLFSSPAGTLLVSAAMPETTGITEPSPAQDVTQLELYPNPAGEGITLRPLNLSGQGSIVIFDLTGRQMPYASPPIKEDSKEHFIDLSGFPSGIYILRYSTRGFSCSKKFVVNK